MSQQLTNGHIVLAVLGKLGNILRYRIVQLDLPKLHHAHHRGRRRNDLGKRSDIKDSVGSHRLLRRLERAAPVGLAINHCSIVANQQDGSRSVSLLHSIPQQRIERREGGLTGTGGHCGSGSSRILRRRWRSKKQKKNKRNEGERRPAEAKTQWIRTLSNSTILSTFGEQAIISCARIPRFCEDLLDHPTQPSMDLSPAFADQEKQFARAFSIIRDGVEQHAFPGAVVAVTHRGSLVASQAFGRFTYDNDAAMVQAETVFDLASVTKVIATTAVAMLLYDRGRLKLDVPLASLLPEFVSLAPRHQQAAREAVTVRMLLAHSSGLPAYEKLFQFAHTRNELIHAALTTRLAAPPGTRNDYSDIGFILLGELLARRADLALDVFAQQEIFMPLGMTRTRFNPPLEWRREIPPTEDDHAFRKRIIQGEVNDENAYVMDGVAGHAGVFAPATDVARFAECMLRSGAPLFQPATVQIFTRREDAPAGTSRALGWDTPSPTESSSGRRFSQAAFGHLGFTGSSLWIDPGRQLSVTLLTNRTWPDRAALAIRQLRPLMHDAIVEGLEEA